MEATASKRRSRDYVDPVDVLRTARRLALPDGSVRIDDVAAAMKTSSVTVRAKVKLLAAAGKWPYTAAIRGANKTPRPLAPPLDPELVLAAAAKIAMQGHSPGVQRVSRAMNVGKQRAREAIARLIVANRWPYELRGIDARTCNDAELAERIANRPLPAREHDCGNGRVVVHRNPGPHPDEVDDPRVHGWFAVPRSVLADHHKAPPANAQIVAGYVREWKRMRRRHRKAVWT